ncbi:cobalamin biosynthesis protein [Granulicella sp. S190]|uniref:cobalamin biosynthesis protein n=1 Tax=Granulicella sp. S190 TaxID=1747226 RepID=UPI00131A8BAC|nr:cobalamin biosynthesis protein [Granulicella sp. S190]
MIDEAHSIGIGCSSRATAADVIKLIKHCIGEVAPNTVIATRDGCSSIGEIVASTLRLRLMIFPASVLAQIRGVKNYSSIAETKVGTPSVAEASALAALGPLARLVLPRQIGCFCTCAVAVLP